MTIFHSGASRTNRTGKNGRDAKRCEAAAVTEINDAQLTRRDDSLARGVSAALGRGQVDPKDAVQFLENRLAEAERNLAELGRSMDRMNRRFSQMQSQLKCLSIQASDHEEALRMMCEVLRDLDDPYGFGQSLDERIIDDGTDRTSEWEEG
jgi:hypothetical protein